MCTGPKTKAGRARSVKAGREGLLRWWARWGPGGEQQVHERGPSASGGKDAADNGGRTGKATGMVMMGRQAKQYCHGTNSSAYDKSMGVHQPDDHHRRTTNMPRPATTVVTIVPTKTQIERASARRAHASSCALITNAGSGSIKSGAPSMSLRALVTRGWLTASRGRASNELAVAARSMFVRATSLPSASSRKSNEASLR